jgi:hypothetical protein
MAQSNNIGDGVRSSLTLSPKSLRRKTHQGWYVHVLLLKVLEHDAKFASPPIRFSCRKLVSPSTDRFSIVTRLEVGVGADDQDA